VPVVQRPYSVFAGISAASGCQILKQIAGWNEAHHTCRKVRMPIVTAATRLPVSAERAFALHTDVRNLPKLTPPPGMRVVRASVPTSAGDVQVLSLGPCWAAVRWVAAIEVCEPPRLLIDSQRRGPFRRFRHAHVVIPNGDGCVLIDAVDFQLFPARVGWVLDVLLIAPALRLLFAERHRRTRALLRETTARR
jgi:ligand-binding SRPBCC domain-containing protein